jgi:hypothetical protein
MDPYCLQLNVIATLTSLHAKWQRQEHRFAIIVFMPPLLFIQV